MRSTGRYLVAALAAFAVCAGLVIYLVGMRFPPPQLEPAEAPTGSLREAEVESGQAAATAHGAIFQRREGRRLIFRAFVPEPRVRLTAPAGDAWEVEVGNIHPDATLETDASGLSESRDNLRRVVSGSTGSAAFGWRFPKHARYRFAAIGDTGGGRELRWVLRRAQALGADFVLHLGDLYYGPGEYLGAVAAFDEAGIPTFAAIGNHDFYDGFAPVHQVFRRRIGPRNMEFRLGGVRFISLDTAAAFFPADSGARGRFIRKLERDDDADDVVLFTHRPLVDPRPGKTHSVSERESRYLHRQLRRLGVHTLLAGHVHIRDDFDDRGVRTIVSGEGLAHADLIVDHPYAHILLADVSPDQPAVSYHWAPLEMPFDRHCNPRNRQVLEALKKREVLARLERGCAAQ